MIFITYDLTFSTNAIYGEIYEIPVGGAEMIAAFYSTESDDHFRIQADFAYVISNTLGQSVNKWYTKTPTTVDITYEVSGYCKKTDSGDGATSFSVNTGVSGLSVGDLIITDNNEGLRVINVSINGTVVSGEMVYY